MKERMGNRRFLPIIFVILICIGCCSLLVNREKTIEKKSTTQIVFSDWESLYPHKEIVNNNGSSDDNTLENLQPQKKTIKKHLIELYLYYLNMERTIKNASAIENKLLGYQFLRELGGKVKRTWAKGVPYVSSTSVELEDGYIVGIQGLADESLQTQYSNEVEELNDFLSELSIPLLYVQPPSKICYEDDYLPGQMHDYTNQNIDSYLQQLESRGIDCIDLREEFHQLGFNHHEMFYKTDHHWNVNAGFITAQLLLEKMGDCYSINVDDASTIDDYTEVVYHDAMFGSSGNTAGRGYSKPEDFSILYPRSNMQFHVVSMDIGKDLEGSMVETMVNTEQLRCMEGVGGYAYEQILGNRALTRIYNQTASNQTRILVIKDSFALAVVPYLAEKIARVDLMDLRESTGCFSGSVKAFIEAEQPDLVIILQSYPQHCIK